MPVIARRHNLAALLRGRHVEALYGAFALCSYAAMLAWPRWQVIPYDLVWLSLVLVYGFRPWALRTTLVVLAGMVLGTAVTLLADTDQNAPFVRDMLRLPLLIAMFLVMVWHASRRIQALRMTEQRAEERRSMLERQERFLQDASHELRTPITIARGHLEVLRSRSPEADRGELAVALDELSRMDGIIERLLLLAGAGNPDFVRQCQIDVEPFLEDVFMRWCELAPRAWRLGRLAPGTVTGDPDRLRTALDALLENAVKYSPEHAVIELGARDCGDGWLAIEVRDEGCGIAPEALDRIFERFARADAARTRTAGGVGLGLAIVEAITQGHGGRCLVHSGAIGSMFSITLPGYAATPLTMAPPAHAVALMRRAPA